MELLVARAKIMIMQNSYLVNQTSMNLCARNTAPYLNESSTKGLRAYGRELTTNLLLQLVTLKIL